MEWKKLLSKGVDYCRELVFDFWELVFDFWEGVNFQLLVSVHKYVHSIMGPIMTLMFEVSFAGFFLYFGGLKCYNWLERKIRKKGPKAALLTGKEPFQINPLLLMHPYNTSGDERVMGTQEGISLKEYATITDPIWSLLQITFKKKELLTVDTGRIVITTHAFVYEGNEINHRIEWDKIVYNNCRDRWLKINFRHGRAKHYAVDDKAKELNHKFLASMSWFSQSTGKRASRANMPNKRKAPRPKKVE